MKRILSLVLVLMMTLSLCACKDSSESSLILTDEKTIENSIDATYYPQPKTDVIADSSNSMGASFDYTLEQFTEMLNSSYKQFLGDKSEKNTYFYYDKWTLMSGHLTDDNGVEYSSYYYDFSDVTLTVAVETKSQKVMNIGCGCTYSDFESDVDDYQFTYLIMSAMVCAVGTGYDINDMGFVYYIFLDAINSDVAFYYENAVYAVKYQQDTQDKTGTVLCMVSPISDKAKSTWNLVDYKSFGESIRFEK